jgi:hypothetical protein
MSPTVAHPHAVVNMIAIEAITIPIPMPTSVSPIFLIFVICFVFSQITNKMFSEKIAVEHIVRELEGAEDVLQNHIHEQEKDLAIAKRSLDEIQRAQKEPLQYDLSHVQSKEEHSIDEYVRRIDEYRLHCQLAKRAKYTDAKQSTLTEFKEAVGKKIEFHVIAQFAYGSFTDLQEKRIDGVGMINKVEGSGDGVTLVYIHLNDTDLRKDLTLKFAGEQLERVRCVEELTPCTKDVGKGMGCREYGTFGANTVAASFELYTEKPQDVVIVLGPTPGARQALMKRHKVETGHLIEMKDKSELSEQDKAILRGAKKVFLYMCKGCMNGMIEFIGLIPPEANQKHVYDNSG